MANRKHIFSGSVFEEMAGYARAVIVGEHVYVSGTVGIDFTTGKMPNNAEDQTSTALDSIERALREANSGLHDIVRVRVFAPDPEHVPAISAVLKKRIGFTYPANTTVCCPLAVPSALVEIEVEAVIGSGDPASDL